MIFHQPGNSRGNYHFNTAMYTGKEYAPHFHKNYELIYVLDGSAEVTVNGSVFQMRQGRAALILSNQIHSFDVPDSARIWVAVFSEEYVPAFTSLMKGKQGSTSVFTPDRSVAELLNDQMIRQDCSQIMRKACFYAACDSYIRQVELETRLEKTNFLVGRLLDWIAQHYTENISLKQAAEVFGYEYHYLSRLLNKNFAINFSALLNAYRVEHAAELLQTTELSVTRIAEQSGFQSIRSFNLAFKKLVGKTPNDYRITR